MSSIDRLEKPTVISSTPSPVTSLQLIDEKIHSLKECLRTKGANANNIQARIKIDESIVQITTEITVRLTELNGKYYKDPSSLLHQAYKGSITDPAEEKSFNLLKEEKKSLQLALKHIQLLLELRQKHHHIETRLRELCGISYRDKTSPLDLAWRAYKAGVSSIDGYQQLETRRKTLQKEKNLIDAELSTLLLLGPPIPIKQNLKLTLKKPPLLDASHLVTKMHPPDVCDANTLCTEKGLPTECYMGHQNNKFQELSHNIRATALKIALEQEQALPRMVEARYPLGDIEDTQETCEVFEKDLYEYCTLPVSEKTLPIFQSEGETILEYLRKTWKDLRNASNTSKPTLDTWASIIERHVCSMRVLQLLSENPTNHTLGLLSPDTIKHLRLIKISHLTPNLPSETCPWMEMATILRKDPHFILDVQGLKPQMHEKPPLNIPKLSKTYKQDQQAYSRDMHVYIHLGALYKKKYQLDFYQLIFFFSYARGLLHTFNMLDFKSSEYGLPRYKGSQTRFIGEYEGISTELQAKYPHINFQKGYQVTAQIGLKTIPLSLIDSYPDILFHTPPSEIPHILVYLEQLYAQACASEDPHEIVMLSGKMFWWFCQAKPLKLGDPSTIEMLLRALWEEKKLPSSPWKKDIIPWKETVLEMDVEEFAKNFHKLFANG
ncbi:MAG: hypothetical protein KGZ39_03630 [Simkania sp.]|nr:hypothetical protein [Simkania sp.]